MKLTSNVFVCGGVRLCLFPLYLSVCVSSIGHTHTHSHAGWRQKVVCLYVLTAVKCPTRAVQEKQQHQLHFRCQSTMKGCRPKSCSPALSLLPKHLPSCFSLLYPTCSRINSLFQSVGRPVLLLPAEISSDGSNRWQ